MRNVESNFFFFLIVFLSFWGTENGHCNSNGKLVGYIKQIERSRVDYKLNDRLRDVKCSFLFYL